MTVGASVAFDLSVQAGVRRTRETPRFSAALDLVALPTAVAVARLFVGDTMRRWGAMFVEPDMEAVTAELVAVAVLQTGPEEGTSWADIQKIGHIKVNLIGFRRHIVVEVVDEHDEKIGRPDSATLPADTGLGLVDARAKWGSCVTPRGRVMWAELAIYERTDAGLPKRAVTPSPVPRFPASRLAPGVDEDLLRRVRDGLENL